jgi:hypothetical protein
MTLVGMHPANFLFDLDQGGPGQRADTADVGAAASLIWLM